jgi:hypothetical protein
MLFAILMKARPGTAEQRIAARLAWEPPEAGAKPIAEYWLQTPDPAVVAFSEADNIGQIWAGLTGWDQFFEITVVPAIEVKQGLPILRQMVLGQ